MNMNMNKKPFFIIGTVCIVLILIIAVILIIESGKNPSQSINYVMSNGISSPQVTQQPDVPENEITNEVTDPNEQKIEGEITYVETTDGGKIPVPPTFEYVEGDSKTGAVIQDKNENQFVWVPISDINNYQRQVFVNNGEGTKIEDIDELNLKDIEDYDSSYDDSILNYGGFYVARYEAGREIDNEKPVSKAGVIPWTQIVWEKARNLSKEMYSENDYFQTDLINSYAWDSICNWMRSTGTNIDDSTNYGNYQNSSNGLNKVVETGSNIRWKVNNIYDMAGNAWEYTTEQYGDHERYHIGRGGGYWNYGNYYPISTRGTSEDGSDLYIGFRVVLYLK